MDGLSGVFNSIQRWLFPFLEEELGELNDKQKEFVWVRGYEKVFAHLMFGIIAITANQLYNMLL